MDTSPQAESPAFLFMPEKAVASSNRRFLVYSRDHGFEGDPAGMLAHDRIIWPGGVMTGYVIWIPRQMESFRLANPEAFHGDHLADQDAFTSWLEAKTAPTPEVIQVETF